MPCIHRCSILSGKFKKITLSTLPRTYSFFHSGSKFHNSVPLRKALFRSTHSTGLVGGIAFIPLCRNGSKFLESVPLRNAWLVPLR